jgi:ACS family hexuronate transporter-like MFS transporter
VLFVSTLINYMDRQTMSLVGPQVKSEFRLDNERYGQILAAFSLAYAFFQVPAGYLADRWDVRRTYAGAVAFWSLAGMATALAPSVGALLALRALLGLGESFNWPCALRVTGRVLPPGDRGLGNGIFNSGAAVGAVVTPLVVPLLAARFGWRSAFVAVGALGFVWVALWLALTWGRRGAAIAGKGEDVERGGPKSGLAGPARAAFGSLVVVAGLLALGAFRFGQTAIWWSVAVLMVGPLVVARALPTRWLEGAGWAEGLGELIRRRRFWVMVVVSISVNVCWHFLVNWLPTYLRDDRDLTAIAAWVGRVGGRRLMAGRGEPRDLAVAGLTALVFLVADLGNLGGGALSRRLARAGLSPSKARGIVMAGCAALISAGAWVGGVRGDATVVILLAVMAFGTAAFMANYFGFCQEVEAQRTGLVVGILGGMGNLFAAAFLPVAGRVKDATGGFGPVFVVVGLLPIVGVAALALGWGRDPDPQPEGEPA